jgi:hypothetical protein
MVVSIIISFLRTTKNPGFAVITVSHINLYLRALNGAIIAQSLCMDSSQLSDTVDVFQREARW